MMQKNVETDLKNKKYEIINSLIDLIESRTKYRFNFDFKFIRPEATNLQSSSPKGLSLSSRLIDDYLIENLNSFDNFKLTRGLIDLFKSYLLSNLTSLNSNEENEPKPKNCQLDSYLVELIDELDQDEFYSPNIQSTFSESMSNNVLNDSFNLVKIYDFYAENLVNEIVNDVGKENRETKEKEIEIKIKLPTSFSYIRDYFQRRHSADVVSFNYKSDCSNPTLPNIIEDSHNDIDFFWRRHSLNNASNKLNKPFNNTMPIIVVDFEDEIEGKSSSRSSLDRSRLSDSESEIANSQFKQYTKVTLKNLLNKSPIRAKNKNELVTGRNEDFCKENVIRKSEFSKQLVEDIISDSMNTVQCIIRNNSLFAQNLVESTVESALDDVKNIVQIRKINHLYLKCDCVNINHYRRTKDRLDCKLMIYVIFNVLEELNYSNSAIFICKNYDLIKKLNTHGK